VGWNKPFSLYVSEESKREMGTHKEEEQSDAEEA